MINDTVEVGRTDLDGVFKIDIPVSVNKILFRSVGMEPAIIELADNCDEVEVVMMLSSTYDFKTLKKVDRLRMKRFKKLPELHKEAALYAAMHGISINEFIQRTGFLAILFIVIISPGASSVPANIPPAIITSAPKAMVLYWSKSILRLAPRRKFIGIKSFTPEEE